MPSVNIKVDGQKVNGGTISGSSGLFPSTTSSPDYVTLKPNGVLVISIPNVGTEKDSVVILTNTLNLSASSYFSGVVADTGVNRAFFTVTDVAQIADSGFVNYRIINAIPNATINVIRIDSTSTTSVTRDTIARNIAYKSSTGFLKVATAITGGPTVRIRIATTSGLNLITSAPGFTNRRVITQYASGFAGGTSSFAPNLGNLVINK
jgi:hypothetical protein